MKSGYFVNVTFVNDSEMKELNNKYRKKDYPTDVLSFNVDEEILSSGEDMVSGEALNGAKVGMKVKYYMGDIVINIDQAKRQAEEAGVAFEEEISKLVAHGMLHLQGVHHEGDE